MPKENCHPNIKSKALSEARSKNLRIPRLEHLLSLSSKQSYSILNATIGSTRIARRAGK